MQAICDILLLDELPGSSKLLQQLKIFSPLTTFDENRIYPGFLGLEVKRIQGVAILMHFRNNGARCLNVPIKYKGHLLTEEETREVAERSLPGSGKIIGSMKRPGKVRNPMFWNFLWNQPNSEQGILEGGGRLVVDALDGHIWSADELEEFSYDHLNAI